MTDHMTSPLRLSLLREQVEGIKSAVPRYWREADQVQREAICFTAKLPFTFATEVLTLDRASKERLRQAVVALGLQHVFHGCMSKYEWHAGCLPEQQVEGRAEEKATVSELDGKRSFLKGVINNPPPANSGQEKTQVNSAANA